MYVLLGISQCLMAWGFWAVSPSMFFGGIFLSVLALMFIDFRRVHRKGGFFETCINTMPNTECCLVHKVWSSPHSVRWTTILFRGLAGFISLWALIVSWSYRKSFLEGRYALISSVWCAASIVWIISCFPMFICLIQCAASSRYTKTQCALGPREVILRFRKVSAVWLLHDITLGIFWLYTSVMLYDLSDDQDDSEWRTIFLSMLSWHILIVAFHQVYLAPLLRLQPVVSSTSNGSKPCCSPKNGAAIWSFVGIISYTGMYAIIVLRFNQGHLLNMGTTSLAEPVLFSVCQIIFVMSKYYQDEEADYVRSESQKKTEEVVSQAIPRTLQSSLTLDF